MLIWPKRRRPPGFFKHITGNRITEKHIIEKLMIECALSGHFDFGGPPPAASF